MSAEAPDQPQRSKVPRSVSCGRPCKSVSRVSSSALCTYLAGHAALRTVSWRLSRLSRFVIHRVECRCSPCLCAMLDDVVCLWYGDRSLQGGCKCVGGKICQINKAVMVDLSSTALALAVTQTQLTGTSFLHDMIQCSCFKCTSKSYGCSKFL